VIGKQMVRFGPTPTRAALHSVIVDLRRVLDMRRSGAGPTAWSYVEGRCRHWIGPRREGTRPKDVAWACRWLSKSDAMHHCPFVRVAVSTVARCLASRRRPGKVVPWSLRGGDPDPCVSRGASLVGCEEVPFSGQARPSAAARRRAGPVLAALRAAGPAAARRKARQPEEQSPRPPGHLPGRVVAVESGPALSATDPDHGRPAPVKAAARPYGIALRASLDRHRQPAGPGSY
jgi:hypothetical protein